MTKDEHEQLRHLLYKWTLSNQDCKETANMIEKTIVKSHFKFKQFDFYNRTENVVDIYFGDMQWGEHRMFSINKHLLSDMIAAIRRYQQHEGLVTRKQRKGS